MINTYLYKLNDVHHYLSGYLNNELSHLHINISSHQLLLFETRTSQVFKSVLDSSAKRSMRDATTNTASPSLGQVLHETPPPSCCELDVLWVPVVLSHHEVAHRLLAIPNANPIS